MTQSLFSIETYEDIKSLWKNRIRESINLEYKREITPDAKEISKDISSFANSEGGVIIYGVGEDENHIPTYSEGVSSGNNSERIQQIVSSSIRPALEIKIAAIDVLNNADNKRIEGKEFVVVKIPQGISQPYQVTTTNRFYFRNNTTTKWYDALEMTEHDIALRYRERFRTESEQEDALLKKQEELKKRFSYNRMFFISAMPVVKCTKTDITKALFDDILSKSDESPNVRHPFYKHIPYDTSKPTGKGREVNKENQHFELDEERRVFYSYPIEERSPADGTIFGAWDIEHIAEFLFAVNRFYTKINHISGITIVLSLSDIKHVRLIIDEYSSKHIIIEKNYIQIKKRISFLPFDEERATYEIAEKILEHFGIDNGFTLMSNNKYLKERIAALKRNMGNEVSLDAS